MGCKPFDTLYVLIPLVNRAVEVLELGEKFSKRSIPDKFSGLVIKMMRGSTVYNHAIKNIQ